MQRQHGDTSPQPNSPRARSRHRGARSGTPTARRGRDISPEPYSPSEASNRHHRVHTDTRFSARRGTVSSSKHTRRTSSDRASREDDPSPRRNYRRTISRASSRNEASTAHTRRRCAEGYDDEADLEVERRERRRVTVLNDDRTVTAPSTASPRTSVSRSGIPADSGSRRGRESRQNMVHTGPEGGGTVWGSIDSEVNMDRLAARISETRLHPPPRHEPSTRNPLLPRVRP
jgi:hypothetical protein